ncbi:hypothetical protein DB30_00098 [Enhygromyxa salina]|uniref:Uncharacterized protein n=2 Tax=Enhygromyxa salina TaxID=215803 RepID=A0A0C1ZPL7_9BACT|nr:hypothetical protein DB30_00098 [Enhygromyxa salina]
MITQLESPHCEVALELIDDHFPLLLVRWAGRLQAQHVLKLIRFCDVHGAVAASEGRRLVLILDAREAALPNSLVRDMLIDWLSDRPRTNAGGKPRSYVIATDPLIRGVVASLKWATGRGEGIQVVKTLEQAIAGARETFEASGVEVPEILRDE